MPAAACMRGGRADRKALRLRCGKAFWPFPESTLWKVSGFVQYLHRYTDDVTVWAGDAENASSMGARWNSIANSRASAYSNRPCRLFAWQTCRQCAFQSCRYARRVNGGLALVSGYC